MVAAAEILVAAGATRLYPVCSTLPMIESRDLDKLRQLKPSAMEMSPISYHPLGTCRMGKNPRDSVVGLDHQTHEVRGLYITDGSTTRGPLGVNPQITIMALATRAAAHIAAAL
jgi:choline dehydrogenase-like flavoprotein